MQSQRLRPSGRATKPALSHVKSLRTTPDNSDIAWLLTWRASWMAATGVPFGRGEGSMSKLAASEVAVRTTQRAVQTMGCWGYVKDSPVQTWYRDAKLYTIFEGTSEIQRIVIAHALGTADGKPPCTSISSRQVDR
jgi:alkylation response protein AidB-like acyl-CoA dehydrogenase